MEDKNAKKNYATKGEIGELNEKFDKLLEVLAKKPEDKKEPDVVIETQASPEMATNPKWIQAVREILGDKVGINILYPDNGPIKVQINIPRELSNSPEDLWSYYKCDIRTIVLNSGEGIDKIKLGCQKIARNLGIDSRSVRNQINQ